MDDHQHHAHHHHAMPVSDGVKDLVCGMAVDPAQSKHKAEYEGKTFHFCSNGCREKFIADPGRYLSPKTEAPSAALGTI